MRRKLFTFLVAFLATLSGAVWGQEKTHNINTQGSLEIFDDGEYIITGTGEPTLNTISVNPGAWEPSKKARNVTIRLRGVNMKQTGKANRCIALYRAKFIGGYASNVKIILERENKLYSQDATALYVDEDVNLTISEESTGTLTAEGYIGIGCGSGTTAGYGKTGDITIKGGTVIAKGSETGIGGRRGSGTSFTINGNTFVVVEGGISHTTSVPTYGILCDVKKDGSNIATVYGKVTLNSPFPKGYRANIDKDATLTLGDNVSMPKADLVKEVGNETRLYAYQTNYDASDSPCSITETLPANDTYYGSNCVLETPNLTCSTQTHAHIGWTWTEPIRTRNNKTEVYPSISTPSAAGPAVSTSNGITLSPVWIDLKRETVIASTKKQLDPSVSLNVYPNTITNVTFEDRDNGLPAGLSLADDGRTITGKPTTATGSNTPTEVHFKVKEGNIETDYETVVPFIVMDSELMTLKSAELRKNTDGYRGSNFNVDDFIKVVDVQGVELNSSYYTIECTFTSADKTVTDTRDYIKDVGIYTNIKIKPIVDKSQYEPTLVELTCNGTITVTPVTVTIIPDKGQSVNEGATLPKEITYTYNLSFATGETPKFKDALLKLDEATDANTPGTYTIVKGDDFENGLKDNNVENKQFDASNYTIALSDEPVTFLIKKDMGKHKSDFTITLPKDPFKYIGEIQKIPVAVVEKGKESPLLQGTDYEVSVLGKNHNETSFLNVDEYTVTISGRGSYVGEITAEKTASITPITIEEVKAADQYIKVGETVKTNPAVNPEIVKVTGLLETPTYTGSLSYSPDINTNVEGDYPEAIQITNLSWSDNQQKGFLTRNYTALPSSFGKGGLYISSDITIEIPDETILINNGDGTYSIIYDGKEHGKEILKGSTITITKDGQTATLGEDDYTLSFEPTGKWVVGTTYVGTLTATKDGYNKATTKLVVNVLPKPLTVKANDVTWTVGEAAPTFAGTIVDGAVEQEKPILAEGGFSVAGDYSKAGDYAITGNIGTVKLTDAAVNKNYTIGTVNPGTLTVKENNPTDPEIKPGDGEWTGDAINGYSKEYDGIAETLNTLKATVHHTDGSTKEVTLTKGVDYTVSVSPNTEIKHVNAVGYAVTITFEGSCKYYSGSTTIKLVVIARPMTLDFHFPQSLTEGETPNWNAKTKITFENLAKPNEKVETPAIKDECRLVIENGKAVLKGYPYIVDNTATGFKMGNYKVGYKNNGKDITITPDENGDVVIPEIPVNPDEGGDGGDGQDPINYYNIYNETTYDFIDVSFSRNVVREGGSVNVYLEIPEGLDPAAVTLMFKRSLYGGWENLNTDDDGNCPIRNIWTDIYVKAVVDESYIDPNPDENHIYIDLSETNDSIWLYTERKLVEEGKTAVIQAEVAKSCQNKEIRYMYKRTVLGEWKEMPKDYSINQYVVRDITTDIYVKAYFVFDKQDPTTAKNPHHVYADITATCEGLYLDATRHKVADEGDTKVFLYVKKGFETKDARYQFKRGLKGEWEDLVPGIEQNTFQVTDIEGDIYLKGIDAVYTGTEDIDSMVRVYTKDGSLFVYTAQPEEISVVSMTGVTVKRTRQTGLQSYRLNQGIYVVCVGEQVFKVRVK